MRPFPLAALALLLAACLFARSASAADPAVDNNALSVLHPSEAILSNSGWNPEFVFEVSVSVTALQRNGQPVVLCEVFGPTDESPGGVHGWGKQYTRFSVNNEGNYSGRVSVYYKVPSRFNAQEAKRYVCSLYLHDNRGFFIAPGSGGALSPLFGVKPGAPLTWQVGGDIPPE